MRYHILLSLIVLLGIASQSPAQTAITITSGTWDEVYIHGAPGDPGNVFAAEIQGTGGWQICMPAAVLQSWNGGSGTQENPYDLDYTISIPPLVMTNGSEVARFSSLTIHKETVIECGVQNITLTTSGVCDAGCYSLDLMVTALQTQLKCTGPCGIITGGTATLTPLKAFHGTWCETFGPEGPGSTGGTLTASMSGSRWTIDLPCAIHQGVVGGSGTSDDPWISEYQVDPTQPATIQYGSIVATFSSLTVVNKNASGVPLFEVTATGVCDAGCYQFSLSGSGTVDHSSVTSTGMCGSLCGDAALTLLKMFDGTWSETFGPEGPGSAGGTLTASMSGSDWTIDLPCAIHQGVVGGSGTTDDPWISEYQVDPTQPATIQYGSIVATFSSLTVVNSNASGIPLFQVTATGVCDAGCYQFDLSVSGTVDQSSVTSTGMSGSLCGDATLTLLKMFDGTWSETFGPDGPGSAGGTLAASLSGSGWTIDLPCAIHQGVVGGSGTTDDPWISEYQVDPTQPATVHYGSVVATFSSLTLVNRNASGVPLFQVTATGVCDAGCYQFDLSVSGTVDQSSVTSTGMSGSLCGDATLSLLRMFEGTWCETFGPEGPGSAGGTLTASMSGSGWAIDLPSAIHQSIVGGSGTADDPWVTEYQVDPTQPAIIAIDSRVIEFSTLTMLNTNVSGVPLFSMVVSGVDATGCYQLGLTASGTVDLTSVTSTDMCGSLCGEATLKVTLDVSSSAGGVAVLPGEGLFTYDYGTTVQLEATATDPLFEFLGWRGSLFSGLKRDTLTLDTCHQVRATFVSLLDVIYVDDDAAGDLVQNGTIEHPFDSIQEAVEVAAEGATVVVKAGTYYETITIEEKSIIVTSIDPNGNGSPEFPILCGNDQGPVVSIVQCCGSASGQAPELVGLIATGGMGTDAGGILCINSSPVLQNCLIVGNRSISTGGGAMFCKDSLPVLINCTLADNAGYGVGAAGIYAVNSNLTIGNSIIWSNAPANIALKSGSSATITFSNVQGGCSGEGNLDADPMFVAPGHWNGPANPGAIWIAGDYHLASGSPCIDAGDDSDAGAEPLPNGDRINIGAYGGTTQATVSE